MNVVLSSLLIAIPLLIAAIVLSVFDEKRLAAACLCLALWAVLFDTEIKFSANREVVSVSIHSSKKGGA